MMSTIIKEQAPVPTPSYQRAQARLLSALHIDALTLITTLHLLTLCRLAARVANRRCSPPLPAGKGGAPLTYSEARLLLIGRGLRLIAWIHSVLGAVAVIPWNPGRQKNRFCLPPTWTKEELGKRSGIERFFGRVFLFFRLQHPPLCGWSEVTSQVALTYAASIIIGLAAQQADRPDLLRSPKRILAHLWERDSEL